MRNYPEILELLLSIIDDAENNSDDPGELIEEFQIFYLNNNFLLNPNFERGRWILLEKCINSSSPLTKEFVKIILQNDTNREEDFLRENSTRVPIMASSPEAEQRLSPYLIRGQMKDYLISLLKEGLKYYQAEVVVLKINRELVDLINNATDTNKERAIAEFTSLLNSHDAIFTKSNYAVNGQRLLNFCLSRQSAIARDFASVLLKTNINFYFGEDPLLNQTLLDNFGLLLPNEINENQRVATARKIIEVLNSPEFTDDFKRTLIANTMESIFCQLPEFYDSNEVQLNFLKAFIHFKMDFKILNTIPERYFEIISTVLSHRVNTNEFDYSNFFKEETRTQLGDEQYERLKILFAQQIIDKLQLYKKQPSKQELTMIAPLLFRDLLDNESKLILLGNSPNSFISHQAKKITIIHNNSGYTSKEPSEIPNADVNMGKPLFFNETPIGYNIHLPVGETKGICVFVYGGHQVEDREQAMFYPGALNNTDLYLLNHGIAVVKLNLPDLLELHTFQGDMPLELEEKIQACIHHFYDTIKSNPETLSSSLADLEINLKPIFLAGQSFGGRTAIMHAQKYPDTFDGYISQNGILSASMHEKSELPIHNKRLLKEYLDPESEKGITAMRQPVLLMHNKNDHNINIKVTLSFYKKLKKIKGKEPKLLKLFIANSGNPGAENDKGGLANKGHGAPTDKETFARYAQTIVNFVQGNMGVPEMTHWQAHKHEKSANKFYKSATLVQRFIAEARELSAALDESQAEDILWDTHYKPLFYALYYAQELMNNPEKLSIEIERLNSLLTDDMVIHCIEEKWTVFLEYIREVWNVELTEEDDIAHLRQSNEMVDEFKSHITALRSADSIKIQYLLSYLYKENPSLLAPLYSAFERDGSISSALNSAKIKLNKTEKNERRLIINAWKQTKAAVVAHHKIDEKVMIDKLRQIRKKMPDSP